jgi:hypothetical protein
MEYGLQWGVQNMVSKIESKKDILIHTGKINSIGLRGVRIQDLKVFPKNIQSSEDTLFSSQEMSISVRLLPLLFGKLNIEALELNHSRIGLFRHDAYSNYSCLFSSSLETNTSDDRALSNRLYRIFSLLFQGLPNHLHIKNLRIETLRNGVQLQLPV